MTQTKCKCGQEAEIYVSIKICLICGSTESVMDNSVMDNMETKLELQYSRFIQPWLVYLIDGKYYVQSAVALRDDFVPNPHMSPIYKKRIIYSYNNLSKKGGTRTVHVIETERAAKVYISQNDLARVSLYRSQSEIELVDLIHAELEII